MKSGEKAYFFGKIQYNLWKQREENGSRDHGKFLFIKIETIFHVWNIKLHYPHVRTLTPYQMK